MAKRSSIFLAAATAALPLIAKPAMAQNFVPTEQQTPTETKVLACLESTVKAVQGTVITAGVEDFSDNRPVNTIPDSNDRYPYVMFINQGIYTDVGVSTHGDDAGVIEIAAGAKLDNNGSISTSNDYYRVDAETENGSYKTSDKYARLNPTTVINYAQLVSQAVPAEIWPEQAAAKDFAALLGRCSADAMVSPAPVPTPTVPASVQFYGYHMPVSRVSVSMQLRQ